MIEEARKVLNYPKIKEKFGLGEDEIKQTVLNLLRYSTLIDNPPALDVIKEDPEDNKVSSVAIKGKADYIVSGDSHLLDLKGYKGIRIITPRRFCEIIGCDKTVLEVTASLRRLINPEFIICSLREGKGGKTIKGCQVHSRKTPRTLQHA